jgi:3-methyladenine DNA glycosylase AlkD
MTLQEVMKELEAMGSASIKKTFLRHGAVEPFFGVKVGDLKKIQKKVKVDYQLSLDLFDTGNSDAMYLAGLIADDDAMTKKDLQKWVKGAYWYMISCFTVPWVAAESQHGWELGLEWIESKKEQIAAAGWSTLASVASIVDDDALDIGEYKKLLDRVGKTIHDQPNRVRYVMNGFVIAVGAFIAPLTEHAKTIAKKVGTVSCDMGDTACEVPDAMTYIGKIEERGSIGKKKKTTKC